MFCHTVTEWVLSCEFHITKTSVVHRLDKRETAVLLTFMRPLSGMGSGQNEESTSGREDPKEPLHISVFTPERGIFSTAVSSLLSNNEVGKSRAGMREGLN